MRTDTDDGISLSFPDGTTLDEDKDGRLVLLGPDRGPGHLIRRYKLKVHTLSPRARRRELRRQLRARFGGSRGRVREDVEQLRRTRLNRAWLVDEELAALPARIDDRERVLDLARATLGNKLGLLALTDRRLVFLYKRDEPVTLERDAVTARAALDKGLAVATQDHEVVFTDVLPEGRAAELAGALPQRDPRPPPTARVKQLTHEQLTRTWLAEEELRRLPAELDPNEDLLELARATRDSDLGLLAVTDKRLVFLAGKDQLVAFGLDAILARGAVGNELVVTTPDGDVVFTDVAPKGRAAALAEALPQRGASPPRAARVKQLAREQLTRTWLVEEELGWLPAQLGTEEELLELARAAHGSDPGLVAVTDRRVLFLYRKREPIELPLPAIARCSHKGRTLKLVADRRVEFEAIAPKERAPAVAARIKALSGGESRRSP